MAAKCAYVEKVGAIYYVRKRLPRAWQGRVAGTVLRLSLGTKDRAEAIRRGLEALAVFEELLRMEPQEALKHLTQRLIDEQLLQPAAMSGADLVRRRALGSVGNKIIRRAREELGLGEHLDTVYQELVHFNQATVQGEALYAARPKEAESRSGPYPAGVDLSGFDRILDALGAAPRREAASRPVDPPAASRPPVPSSATHQPAPPPVSSGPVYTLRYLMTDYLGREGKTTGSDNRANIERAVKLFEDLCPEVRTLAVPDIPLAIWDQLHEFAQLIPQMRGRATPDNLVAFTRQMQAKGGDYPRLGATTLNSNYLGAITRLVRHGNRRRMFSFQAPSLMVHERRRASRSSGRAPFSAEEITAITSCPVYAGSASRLHRYSPGDRVFADDHIYWAPLISMHTGMRITEIGMLRPAQMQTWFGRPTLVLELEDGEAANDEEGYKTGNAVRRIPVHPHLVEIGFLKFWERQQELGHDRLFPNWTQHRKGAARGRPEVHFEADFFNAHRLKWNVPAHRAAKLTFHSFRGFFIQACHDARVDAYTILKWVGHDEDTEAQTNAVHRGYMSKDLTVDEVVAIDRVIIPLGTGLRGKAEIEAMQ
ncbi:MAG TPA: site-specific integrase [Rhodopila sp.]|jgi:integrase|uniref:site-specific integrase n=1 Tax=Rhodopila sp. TaxID=2480087 RepID=UPI002C611875|nr:site-specific integrase [Rhodopila sp.]HVY15705.1 site-specific integrase [Rhodopila sp.]